MEIINKRLTKLTGLSLENDDPESDKSKSYNAQLTLLQNLSKVWQAYEKIGDSLTDDRVKRRLDLVTKEIMKMDTPPVEEVEFKIGEVKTLDNIIKTWQNVVGTEFVYDVADSDESRDRRSLKVWDDVTDKNSLITKISLTERQKQASILLNDDVHDKVLLLGGSGSGKTFKAVYKIIKDALRYKAPCLIARNTLVDLTQGVIDQTVPAILQLIAQANGKEKWQTWTIDGLKFAKFTEKKTKLEFATGGYVRFAGLSARDLSESGSDKILSPSWLHIELEEVSELDWGIVEKLLTRLRHQAKREEIVTLSTGRKQVRTVSVLNKLIMTENPPSINHFTYNRFIEKKREDGSTLSKEEIGQYAYMKMNPSDNVENLGETYIRNLSQMSGANKARFFDGEFQEMEEGEILKNMKWTSNLPSPDQWEKLCVYTDPTPLTTKEHSVWADFKASVLTGLFNGMTFVIDVRLVRGSTMQMLQNIKQLYDVSPNKSITQLVMEKKAVPSDFKQVMTLFSATTGWVVPIKMDTRHFGDKKQAIETFLEPLFTNEMIFFNEAFRNTERGKQTQYQINKFSRKANKLVHDDVPDAIMKADTFMKGKKGKIRKNASENVFTAVTPAYIHLNN